MLLSGVLSSEGGGGYIAPAVHFDVSTYLGVSSLTSTDNSVFSWSGWFKISSIANAGGATAWSIDPEDTQAGNAGFIPVDPSGIFITGIEIGSASVTIGEVGFPAFDTWFNVLGTIDLSGVPEDHQGKLYVNDVDLTVLNPGEETDLIITTNGLPFFVTRSFDDDPDFKLVCDVSNLWIAPGVSLLVDGDIPEETRRLFISATGKPVNPSGFPASAMLFSGDAATFADNQGTGGTFTTTGTLIDADSSPSD
jgi:hypothetical protein